MSRYAFAEPMKSKSQEESLRAFELIVGALKRLSYNIGTVDSDLESSFRGGDF